MGSISKSEAKQDISHKLIHIMTNPPIEESNDYDLEGDDGLEEDDDDVEYVEEEPNTQKIIKFASVYVSEIVIKNFEKSIMNKMRIELNVSLSNSISNSVLSSIFEEIAHTILKNVGKFKIRSLDDSARYDQTINRRDKIYTFSTIETMTNGNYFRPDNKNFPSIDSIIAPDKLFQMTTAINHPIKMIGLKKVYAKLAKTGNIDFFFTVPAQLFESYKKQKFVTTNNNNAKRKPSWIKNRVKQYVLGIDLSSKLDDVDEGNRLGNVSGGDGHSLLGGHRKKK
ncbi:2109_t:CDS:1 [Funneliformis caledonium]|uniref:2109_t:CDS:1 n=1 Tax=Funneliformis caledonium TaxID=1117310 RepID=A0A9N9ENU3_9GLOM|nr:2109_t:CDS:1 [Funneliformis caledonium]